MHIMVTYSLTPTEKERVNTVKANMARAGIDVITLANIHDRSRAHVLDVFKGRYTSDVTDTWLTQYEHYLNKLLGVRYIQPYFNDIEAE